MCPYHNKIKQRRKKRELLSYAYIDQYKGISPCLFFDFETELRTRPIREHRFEEYEVFLRVWICLKYDAI